MAVCSVSLRLASICSAYRPAKAKSRLKVVCDGFGLTHSHNLFRGGIFRCRWKKQNAVTVRIFHKCAKVHRCVNRIRRRI